MNHYFIKNELTIIKKNIGLGEIARTRKICLKKNKVLEKVKTGKRCFILANGPSINSENIECLKNEDIFTVNQMIRKKEFVRLSPICNFWFDPAYFDENMPEDSKKEFAKLFQQTCECNSKIINFVPFKAYEFLSKMKLISDRVFFIDDSLYFYDNYNQELRYDGCVPYFQNIVHYAIGMAIYMGYSEIYLLGCDSTGILTKINSVLDKDINNCYTYDLGEKEQKYVNSLLDYFSIEEQFAGWARIFHIYKELYKYCKKRNIKLTNCSGSTIIEGIPRESLERVVGYEK